MCEPRPGGRPPDSRCSASGLTAAIGRFSFENRREFLEENGDEFMALHQSLLRLGSELENLPSKPEEVFNFARRAQELQVQFGFLMESEDPNTVFWIERRRGGRDKFSVYLQATPIDVAPILKTCLFDKLECAVLTSATRQDGVFKRYSAVFRRAVEV